jgi:hypothetical protein
LLDRLWRYWDGLPGQPDVQVLDELLQWGCDAEFAYCMPCRLCCIFACLQLLICQIRFVEAGQVVVAVVLPRRAVAGRRNAPSPSLLRWSRGCRRKWSSSVPHSLCMHRHAAARVDGHGRR